MNENREIQNIVQMQFPTLPKELQDFILHGEIRERINEFASLRGLNAETTATIENEVMLVFLGLAKREDLLKNIQENTTIKEGDAQSLASKISQVLFSPLEDAFRDLERHQEAEDSLSEAIEPTPPSTQQNTPQVPSQPLENEEDIHALDRDSLLSEIENPVPGNARHEKMGPNDERPVNENLVQTLSNKEENDPYREAI